MSILNDPSMREIVEEFCDESQGLFLELQDFIDALDENPLNNTLFEKFGQTIDRVMGAAKSIGADDIGTFCELGKVISYKASQVHDVNLLPVVVAILADEVELLNMMIEELKTGSGKGLKDMNTSAFITRLKWLSEKFKHIERASVAVDKGAVEEESIEDLLSNLGIK